jgi:hypothetical protein
VCREGQGGCLTPTTRGLTQGDAHAAQRHRAHHPPPGPSQTASARRHSSETPRSSPCGGVAPVAAAGQAWRSACVAGADLWLVHRGVRHRRPAGGQGITRGVGVTRRPRVRPSSPTMLVASDYNLLSMKSFHGVLTRSIHTCLLKTSLATVSNLLVGLRKQHWRRMGASCWISQLLTCRSIRSVRKRLCLELKYPCCFSRPNGV